MLGSGAVGGYYGAKLARAGHDVTFIARGAHLAAIRERGLEIRSPALGDFVVQAAAEEDTARVGPVDVVIVAVKAYDNATALPLVAADARAGDDDPDAAERRRQRERARGALRRGAGDRRRRPTSRRRSSAPGVIEQTGTHRRIVIGEVFGELPRLSDRVTRDPGGAGRRRHPGRSGRGRPRADLGEVHLPRRRWPASPAPRACRSGRCGRTRSIRAQFLEGCREIERLARAEGVPVAADIIERIDAYVDSIPGTMRSSLLIDLSQGKRIEVEALQGSVVRRAARPGVPVPIMSTLYAVLKPWVNTQPR